MLLAPDFDDRRLSSRPRGCGLRGRIAGWYAFSDREVRTADVAGPTAHRDQDPERWPYGLLAYRAFSSDDPPMFKAFLPHLHERNRGFRIVTAFAELTPAEEEEVLGLSAHEVPMPPSVEMTEARAWARQQGLWINRPGPVPCGGEHQARRTNESGSTYLLEREGLGLMKIGWAKDPGRRAAKLSEPLVPGLTGDRWRLVRHQPWSDDRIAYAMEQRFIEAIRGPGVTMEKEYFRVDEAGHARIDAAWQAAWMNVRGTSVDELPPAPSEDDEGT